MEEKNKILIIDGDFILYTTTHGDKLLDEFGEPIKMDGKFVYKEKSLQEVFAATDHLISTIIANTDVNNYVGYLGNDGNFRYTIYPEYKANRKSQPKPHHFKELKEYLTVRYGFNLCNGHEADDAVLSAKIKFESKNWETIVVSPDKDLIKCTSGFFYNPIKQEFISTGKDEANYNFWKSMIVGDTTDNIKGIPGCGEKYATTVLSSINMHDSSYQERVLSCYMSKLGEYEGIQEFYKNYMCLKIKDDIDI